MTRRHNDHPANFAGFSQKNAPVTSKKTGNPIILNKSKITFCLLTEGTKAVSQYYKPLFIVLSLLAIANVARAETTSLSTEASSASAATLLPAVRRVGIDNAKSNLDEFRNFMQKQMRDLSGVAAQPYSQKEFESELNQMVNAVLKDTGRFWVLTLEASDTIDPRNPTGARERLHKTYDLDAWIAADVSFRPDNTRLRFVLQNAQGNRIFIREDALVGSQASLNEIKTALQAAASRFISTLGHDARVTFMRDDLVTIDSGLERGLTKGTKVSAGFVTLSALHPQTGEYFRAKRIKTHTMEVIDSRKGAALCRITSINQVAWSEHKARFSVTNPPLLAWLGSSETPGGTSWRDPATPEYSPMTGTSDSGFDIKSKPQPGYIPPPSHPAGEGYGPATQLYGMGDVPPPQQQYPYPQQQYPYPNQQQIENDQQPITASQPQRSGGAYWDDPASWRLLQVKGGAGLTLGVLDGLNKGKLTRNSGYTSPWVAGFGLFDLGNQLTLDAALNVALYSGGAVTGETYRVAGVVQLPVMSQASSRLDIGGGLAINGGELKAVLLKADNDQPLNLTRFDIVTRVDYIMRAAAMGRLRTTLDFNLLGIFSLEGRYQVELSETGFLPKPMSLNLFYVNYPSPSEKNKKLWWWEGGLGVIWTFL